MTEVADWMVDRHVRYDKRNSAHHTNVGRVSSRPPHLPPPALPVSSVSAPKPHRVQSVSQPASQSIKLINWPAAPHPITLSPALITAEAHPLGSSVSLPVPPSPSRSQAAAGLFPIRNPISTAAYRARRPDMARTEAQAP